MLNLSKLYNNKLIFHINTIQYLKYCKSVNSVPLATNKNLENYKQNDQNLMNVNQDKSKIQKLVEKKYFEYYNLYGKLSGMDEVIEAQEKVIFYQEKLREAQENRRKILEELSFIRNGLRKTNTDLIECQRGDPRYLQLIKQEIDLTALEKEKSELFNLADTEERSLFTHLATAVRMSHEKERIQANTVKYWAIIGSFICTLIGIVGTTLSFHIRNSQFETIKKEAKETNQILFDLQGEVKSLEEETRKSNKQLLLVYNHLNNTKTSPTKIETIPQEKGLIFDALNSNTIQSWVILLATEIFKYLK